MNEMMIVEMTNGYLAYALWAGLDWSMTTENDGIEDNPENWAENYDTSDISKKAVDEARKLCAEFVGANLADLEVYYPGNAHSYGQWGHDLYLTRNGHGAGFWDRYSGLDAEIVAVGRRLSEAAKVYGEIDFYEEGGKLYWNR